MNKQLGEQVKLEQIKKIKAEADLQQALDENQAYIGLYE